MFSKNSLEIVPDIEVGGSVTLVYKNGSLEATSTGIAMEAGIIGKEIRVRNESSKKVVRGKIIEAGQVQVTGG